MLGVNIAALKGVSKYRQGQNFQSLRRQEPVYSPQVSSAPSRCDGVARLKRLSLTIDVQPFLPSEAALPTCYTRFWSSNFHAGCSPACNVNSIQAIHASTEKTKICGLPSVCQKCPTCSVTFYWLDCFSKLCGPFGDKNAQTEANSPPALPGRCTLSQLGQLFIVQLNK